MRTDQGRITGYVFALLASVSAAGAYLFAEGAVARIEPLTLGAIEFLLAVPAAVAWALLEGTHRRVAGIPARVWAKVLVQSCFTFGAILTLWIGLRLVNATTASLLNRVEIFFTVALGMLIFRDRHTWLEGLGGVVAFAGVLVLRWNAPPDLHEGMLWIIASALFFAGAELTAKWLAPDLPASLFLLLRTPVVAMMFTVVVAAAALFQGRPPEMPGPVGWLLAAGVALTGPILARSFYYAALRRIEVSKTALLNQTQPLFVALLALLLFARLPGGREALGGLLILGGTVLLVASRIPFRKSPEEETLPGPDAVA